MTNQKAKSTLILAIILGLGLFLRIYRLPELMVFGGDVARDFIEARNITTEGKIPLLGSPTSVPWLHQGALYTYILGVVLFLGKYNPLIGGYFAVFVGVLSIYILFRLGKLFFSEKAGLWASFFYAVSPLTVIFDRYPYHQNLISIFTMLFFASLYLSAKKTRFFPLSAFILGLLLQIELSNLVLVPALLVLILDYRKKTSFRALLFSLAAFAITWLPKLIYDIPTGFTQTLGFAAWFFHKILPVDLVNQGSSSLPLTERFLRLFTYFSRIVFWQSVFLSAILVFGAILFLISNFSFRKRKENLSLYLLILWFLFPLLGFVIQGSPSESYVPVLFAFFPLAFSYLLTNFNLLKPLSFLFPLALASFSMFTLLTNDYFVLTGKETLAKTYNFGPSFKLNMEMAKHIVKEAGKEDYNLMPLGVFSHFPSSKLNLVYLTWYLGHPPSLKEEKLKFFVYDNSNNYSFFGSENIKKFNNLTIAKKDEN